MESYSLETVFEKMLSRGSVFSQKPVYEGYDKNVQGNTVHERGSCLSAVSACFRDFPELQGLPQSQISVTLASGGNPNYAKIDSKYAASQAILEAWWRVVLIGGEPLAATDCLNFGNPEKKESMGELVAGIEGIKMACEKLNLPIVSGNVSLYNEFDGTSIPPSAIVSCFGRINNPKKVPQIAFEASEKIIYATKNKNKDLGGSAFLSAFAQKDHHLPQLNYKKLQDLALKINSALNKSQVSQINIIAQGGLFNALIESAFKENIGITLKIPKDMSVPHFLFCEDLGFIFTTDLPPSEIKDTFKDSVVPIGKTTKQFELVIEKNSDLIYNENLKKLKNLWENHLGSVFA